MKIDELITRIQKFEEELRKPFVGRDEESRVVVLALLTGEHAILIGEPGCVTEDTIVSFEDGKLSYVGDIAKDLPPGIYTTELPIFPPSKATELHVYDVWETYEIVTKRGFRIRGTANHPVMTSRGWVELRNLREGDEVRILSKLPSPSYQVPIPSIEHLIVKFNRKISKVLNEKIAELLGIFSTRGYFLSSESIGLEKRNNENELLQKLTDLIEEISGPEACSVDSMDGRMIVCVSTYLTKLLRLLVDSVNNRVPRLVLSSPNIVSEAFLRGVFESTDLIVDGESPRLVLRSRSRVFLEGIQMLLLRSGILSTILDCSEGLSTCESHELVIEGENNLRKFSAKIGFVSESKKRRLASLIKSAELGEDHSTNLSWDAVKLVRRVKGWVRVYDFHVPGTHAFFTNGLLSHNTAKSALVRRAAELLNARFFKYLLTRYTEPSELFGPLDIRALEEGKYVRLTVGKLPDAQIAFLDEIFKANSAILNALNTLLQERILYDGFTELRVNLWTLFGASNEVPEDPEIQSVYDRFLLRHFVRPVQEDLWRNLLRASWELEKQASLSLKSGDSDRILSIEEIRKINERLFEVDLSSIESKLLRLLAALESRGVHLTDRRKGKSLKVVAANAILSGRMYATEEDLLSIKYLAVRDWDDIEKVNAVLAEELKTPFKYVRELSEIRANLRELHQYVRSLEGIESSFVTAKFENIVRELEITKAKVINMIRESQDPQVLRLSEEVLHLINSIMEIVNRRVSRFE
ncbi:MAG: AAA family ATPase [Desulfurococcaceae archaeon TW002]